MASNSKTNSEQNSVSDLILNGVLTIMQRQDTWIGTMTQLSNSLSRVLGKRAAASLPKSPSALRVSLNRTINRLRNRSVSVRFGRSTDHTRTRYVKFVTR